MHWLHNTHTWMPLQTRSGYREHVEFIDRLTEYCNDSSPRKFFGVKPTSCHVTSKLEVVNKEKTDDAAPETDEAPTPPMSLSFKPTP